MSQVASSEMRLKLGLDELYTGVVITDINHIIVYANDSAVKIFKTLEPHIREKNPHFSGDELLGHDVGLFHDTPDLLYKILNNIESNINHILIFGDRSISVRATAIIDDMGNRIGYMGEFEDITEHEKNKTDLKVLYQQVNQMQKIECLGRLTAGIAHDFNNILQCIIGYNDINSMIAEDCENCDHKEDYLYNAREIANASKRATCLIKKMMAYSRDVPANSEPEIRATKEVINEVLDMVRPAIGRTFTLHDDVDEYLDIQIDATELHQIVTNLIVNARDAMKQGGEITVKLKRITLQQHLCTACVSELIGDYIELSIADNGTGIKQDVLVHIFDPFFTTKTIGEGTGLGLATVSGIVHKANGHIIVNTDISETNHGTKFRLLFPI